jgi:hypothetical protein
MHPAFTQDRDCTDGVCGLAPNQSVYATSYAWETWHKIIVPLRAELQTF